MEQGVLNNVMKGPLGELFDQGQFISDVSGAGNNWAHGYSIYGPQYAEEIEDKVPISRLQAPSVFSFILQYGLCIPASSCLGGVLVTSVVLCFAFAWRWYG
jgi:tubulin epsilon